MAPSVKRAWRHDAASKPGSASKFVRLQRLPSGPGDSVLPFRPPLPGTCCGKDSRILCSSAAQPPQSSRCRPEYRSDGPSRESRRLLGTSMVVRTPCRFQGPKHASPRPRPLHPSRGRDWRSTAGVVRSLKVPTSAQSTVVVEETSRRGLGATLTGSSYMDGSDRTLAGPTRLLSRT